MKTTSGLEVKLPVGDLLKEAFEILWQKKQEVLKIFLPAILILGLLDWLTGVLQEQGEISMQAGQLLIVIPSILLSVLLATTCHQYTLQTDQPPRPVFRWWSSAEWRYLLRGIQIILVSSLVFIVILVVSLLLLPNKEQAVGVSMLGLLPALYIWGRLSIILPEVAVGQPSSLKRAWSLSQGNGLRVTVVVILVPLLLMLPFLLMLLGGNTVLNLISSIGTYLGTLVSLVTLSLSYRFLADFHDNDQLGGYDQQFNA